MIKGSIVAIVTPMLRGRSRGLDQPRRAWWNGISPKAPTRSSAVGTTGESGDPGHGRAHRGDPPAWWPWPPGACRIIAGTGANSTNEAIELTARRQGRGRRRRAAGHPVLQQAAAGRPVSPLQGDRRGGGPRRSSCTTCLAAPACDMLPATVARLAQIPNIVGLEGSQGRAAAASASCWRWNCRSDFAHLLR